MLEMIVTDMIAEVGYLTKLARLYCRICVEKNEISIERTIPTNSLGDDTICECCEKDISKMPKIKVNRTVSIDHFVCKIF